MVQHVEIVLIDGVPIADSTLVKIWRDDQDLSWFFSQEVIAAGWGWDNDTDAGTDKAIQFAQSWQGSIPGPVGSLPETGADIRQYTATGPGANETSTPQIFSYTLYFAKGDTKFSHDPEVGNQPQP